MARDYQTKANVGALPDTITATRFGAGEFNSIAVELENAVSTSDQTLAPADGTGEVTNQLAMALAIYGAGGAFYHADTGAVNAYVLTPISPKESPPAYFDGFTVIFEAGTVNTTASTVNVNSLGVKSITYANGNALTGGELSGSCGIKYNLSDDRFELLFASGGLAGLGAAYIIDSTQADQGAASTNPDTLTIFDVATLVGTSKSATIRLIHNPAAGNTTAFVFDTSLDLSGYPRLKFDIDEGARFTRTTGDEIFTVYSPENFNVGDRQHLTTVDMLSFGIPGKVYPQWWGALSGNDCTNALQYAINSSTRVHLPKGGYRISSAISWTKSDMYISGDGIGDTVLTATATFTAILNPGGALNNAGTFENFAIVTTGYTTRCVDIAGGVINGQRFNTVSFVGDLIGELVKSQGAGTIEFDSCGFGMFSTNTWGIYFDSYNLNCRVSNCGFGGTGNGIQVDNATSSRPEGLRIDNNYFINTGNFNILIGNSLLTLITGNVCDQALLNCIAIHDSADKVTISENWCGLASPFSGTNIYIDEDAGNGHIISNNHICYGTYGVHVDATVSDFTDGVIIDGNMFSDCSNNAIYLNSVTNCVVTNNIDLGTPSGGSWITTNTYGAGDYLFANNKWHTTAPGLFDATSTYRFGNDTGIVGRNRGSNTVADGATIAHGLFTSPTMVQVTGTVASEITCITAANTTTFTMSIKTLAGASGTAQSINWIAEV